MAGHHKRDRIFPDRGADRTCGLRDSDFAGDVRIGRGASQWNAQQRLPHPHFEIRADQHYAQRPVRPPKFLIEDALRNRRRACRVLGIFRLRPAPAHVGERGFLLAGIGEREPAQSAFARHHQRRAERAGVQTIENRQALAAGFPFTRRHRFMRHEQIVQSPRPRKPDFIGGIEHACGVAQKLPRLVECKRLQERFRRQPRPAAKQVMQVGGGDACGFRDLIDFRLRAPVSADMRDGAAHDIVVGGGGGKRLEVRQPVGREHGGLHHLLSI